jgi:hypothetical protein
MTPDTASVPEETGTAGAPVAAARETSRPAARTLLERTIATHLRRGRGRLVPIVRRLRGRQ